MLMKKLLLITLLAATITPPARATNDISRWGMMGAGVVLTSAGASMLYRYQHEVSHRVMDTLIGAALIAAGLYAIATPDKLIRLIERSFR